MGAVLPETVLLELCFRAGADIGGLPHYHGAHWSALFRNLLRQIDPGCPPVSALNFSVIPVDSGILCYNQGDIIHLGISFISAASGLFARVLNDFNQLSSAASVHFQPGRTVILTDVRCRVANSGWMPDNVAGLTRAALEKEIRHLKKLSAFSLLFFTPLRLPRPEGYKSPGRTYCEESFFLDSDADTTGALPFFLNSIRLPNQTQIKTTGLQVESGGLVWLDTPYRTAGLVKTIGGVVGTLNIRGRASQQEAERLVAGQYVGAGKNRAFGFGFYTIPELQKATAIAPLRRETTVFKKIFTPDHLNQTVNRMPDFTPADDGLTADDLRRAGSELVSKIVNQVHPDGLEPKRSPKRKQEEPVFAIEMLIRQACADYLNKIIRALWSRSLFAPQLGTNLNLSRRRIEKYRSNGYCRVITADISAFYKMADMKRLAGMLAGIFPFDPVVPLMMQHLTAAATEGASGLPGRSPLSRALAPLLLDRVVSRIEAAGIKTIRIKDTLLLLLNPQTDPETLLSAVSCPDLCLTQDAACNRLVSGFRLEPVGALQPAIPMVQDAERMEEDSGFKIPVYIDSYGAYAYPAGDTLVIRDEDGRQEAYAWQNISRLVISSVSDDAPSIALKALQENRRVTFIDITGKHQKTVLPDGFQLKDFGRLQTTFSRDDRFCFSFAQTLLRVKRHHFKTILSRNDISTAPLSGLDAAAETARTIDELQQSDAAFCDAWLRLLEPIYEPFKYIPPGGGDLLLSPLNTMVGFGCHLLCNRIASALQANGFKPQRGFYHKKTGNVADTLALELSEALLPGVYGMVIEMMNRGEIDGDDFETQKVCGEAFASLNPSGFSKLIQRFERMMQQKVLPGNPPLTLNGYIDEMIGALKRSLLLGIAFRIDF